MSTTKDNKQYSSKKTILQVVPTLVSGGVERGTIEIAKTLAASGYNSVVVSAGGPLVKRLEEIGGVHINLNVASKNPFVIWNNARRIIKIIQDYNIDIVHARSRAPAWSCHIAAKATGRKFITTFHGIYNISSRIKKYYNSIMTEGEVIIAVSSFVKQHIIENYHIQENKIKIIHRGVDSSYFDPANLNAQILLKFKEKYNVPDGVPVILLPSRMTAWKGHMYLIEALNKIKHLNFYCLMVGDILKHPHFVGLVRNRIKELKLQDKIQIFGNESDIINLYGIADLVLSTSIEPEAFGRTIIEAQAMKKLIIATNIGGAAETIENGVTGYHITPNDPNELADKISYCLSLLSSVECSKITNAARESVINNFSLDKMCMKTLDIYNKLIKH